MWSKLPARLPPSRPRLCDIAPAWFAHGRERQRRESVGGREGDLRNAKLAPKVERRGDGRPTVLAVWCVDSINPQPSHMTGRGPSFSLPSVHPRSWTGACHGLASFMSGQ